MKDLGTIADPKECKMVDANGNSKDSEDYTNIVKQLIGKNAKQQCEKYPPLGNKADDLIEKATKLKSNEFSAAILILCASGNIKVADMDFFLEIMTNPELPKLGIDPSANPFIQKINNTITNYVNKYQPEINNEGNIVFKSNSQRDNDYKNLVVEINNKAIAEIEDIEKNKPNSNQAGQPNNQIAVPSYTVTRNNPKQQL